MFDIRTHIALWLAVAFLSGCASGPTIDPQPLAPDAWFAEWRVIGPFPLTENTDHTTDWLSGEAAFSAPGTDVPSDAIGHTLPHPTPPSQLGMVDLNEALGSSERCIAYAWTEFVSPREGTAVLRMGSDDGIAVWINGQQVWNHRVFRGAMPDQDLTVVPVREGLNRFLVKVEQGEGDWGFFLRLDDPVSREDGVNLKALEPVAPPVLLTGGALPPQQSLSLRVANHGTEAAEGIQVRLHSGLTLESISEPFACEPGGLEAIAIPLIPREDLAAGASGTLLAEALTSDGASFPIAEVPLVSSAIHPLLSVDAPGIERPFTVVQMSDTHIRERDSDMLGVRTADRMQEAIAEINAMDPAPAFVVVTGDFVHDSLASYPLYAELMSHLEVPHLTVFGNHDKVQSFAASERAFSEWGQPPHSAFEMDGVLFVCLDTVASNDPSAKGVIGPGQRRWIQELLAGHPGVPRVFFLHHDLHTGLGVEDFEAVQETLERDPEEQWFFSGHWHADSFVQRGNQRHIVTTSIGYLFDDGSLHFSHQVPGYRLIHVDEDRIWTEFKPLGGEPIADPEPHEYDTAEDVLRALGRLDE